MMTEIVPLVIAALAFATVAAGVYVLAQHYSLRMQVERRLPVAPQSLSHHSPRIGRGIQATIARFYSDARFASHRESMRRELLRAGFFEPDAVDNFMLARLLTAAVLPLLVVITSGFFPATTPALLTFALLLMAILPCRCRALGISGPSPTDADWSISVAVS